MFIDSHCHLFDLNKIYLNFEDELKNTSIIAVSSSTDLEEFSYNEELSKRISKDTMRIYPSFAVHPQMGKGDASLLKNLASEKRLSAIGEVGFDLYNTQYKATEAWQDEIFASHLEIALKFDLPVILHVRRAMHKIFSYIKELKKCKAVIFHSWSGSLEEGQAVLKRGVNAYFSFGNTILNGHKQQVRSCALLPQDRLLTETDAPYQPHRVPSNQWSAGSRYNKRAEFSSWKDLPKIIETIANLKNSSVLEIESQIEENFLRIFNRR